jgi:Lamin Tail Domain/Immunoglobulin I-set domain
MKIHQSVSQSLTKLFHSTNSVSFIERNLLAALLMFVLNCLLAGKAGAASTGLVIAEVYGGGGNNLAAYQNDYVVIFNRGGFAQSVNGWSIQYQTAAGSTWTVVPLANSIIQPGAYHLVQLSGGANGAALPTPDTTGTLNLNTSQGKVALVNSTIALGSQCPGDASVIDKIGYGTTSTSCNETANATAPANNATSMQRKEGGCQDTDDNSADFAVATPDPRNSSTMAQPCITPLSIITQPSSQTNVPGDIADVSVTVVGSDPLSFQWYQDDIPVPIGTIIPNSPTNVFSANLTNVQPTNQGNYFVIVSNVSGMVTSLVATVVVVPTPSTRIARWDFNSGNPFPSEGLGYMYFPGGPAFAFSGGSFSDPAQADAPLVNMAIGSSDYPSSGTGNKTTGLQFDVSTAGYKNILLTWSQSNSATASKYVRLQYSTDSFFTTSFDQDVIPMDATNGSFVFFKSDLSGIPGVNDNAAFSFRLVSEFESTATGSGVSDYVGTAGNYSPSGTILYDLISVYGSLTSEVIPIPLNAQRIGNNLVLTWSDPAFTLQAATNVSGMFMDVVPTATSPYTNALSGSRTFFRLRD